MTHAMQPIVDVVAALVWQGDKFLICQRPAHKARALLWEFPGGKVEPGESHQQALIRECQEELGVVLSVGDKYFTAVHRYPDIHIRLCLYHCVIASGEVALLEHAAFDWIAPADIDRYDFCPADVDILKQLKADYA